MMVDIPRNPKAPTAAKVEKLAKKFIDNAPESAPSTNITLRMPGDLLERIDAAANKEHITRSAWIKSKLSQLLDADN